MASKVYFMNDRANSLAESTPFKAVKLLRDIGIEGLFKKGDTVGIKCHMGEYGNSLNLRPQWIKSIVEEIQRLGGNPVVIDGSLGLPMNEYAGRATEADHLRCVSRHGFNEETLGCPVWIADGEFGMDDVKVPVPHGVYMDYSFIGKKFLDLDACIVVSHFKGHPMGVYGGALKNVGIGMGSKRGKVSTHFLNHPIYGRKLWTLNQEAAAELSKLPHPNPVESLVSSCPFHAFEYDLEGLHWAEEKCRQCGTCFTGGLFGGLLAFNPEILATWAPAMVDAASAYIKAIGAENMLYVSYAMDISPWCDCVSWHDKPLVPNVGVFASKDPVALDMACLEATEALNGMPNSQAEEAGFMEPNTERFTNCSSFASISQWAQVNSGAYNGLGTTEYVLVESEPGPDTDFWFAPYTPENTWYDVNREVGSMQDYDCGCYARNVPAVPLTELHFRPTGKVGTISILDDED